MANQKIKAVINVNSFGTSKAAPPAPPSIARAPSLSRPASSSQMLGGSAAESVASTNSGATELMMACQTDNVELASAIIQRLGSGIVAARDNFGRTALHYGAENGSLKACEIILFHNARLLEEKDVDGCTALHGAVIAGNLNAVRWLIQRGANVDAVDNDQHTVLHWATVSAHPEIVEYVMREVKAKCQPDLHHAYPLHYAAQMCGTESAAQSLASQQPDKPLSGAQGLTTQLALLTLLKLVECGHPLDVSDEDSRQPLIWAANNGAAEACYVLVNAGALPNAADKDGLTALHCAATRGQTRCVAALLRECGARHDAQDSNKCTALFYAATFGHTPCCRVLIEHGANVNHADRKRRTASHCAASKGFLECLKYLISAGANIWLRSVKGDYPISEAIANGHVSLVTHLLASFTPEQRLALSKVNRGRTPLHSSAAANQLELSKVLIDFGAPVNALHYTTTSNQYYSPYDFAVIRGNVELAEYLRARGAAPASKVIKHAARVIQKYFRSWRDASKQKPPKPNRQANRPKSLSNSERGGKLNPIDQPPVVQQTADSPQQPSLSPVAAGRQVKVNPLSASVAITKKLRPTHQRSRTKPELGSRQMMATDGGAELFDSSAGFFDDDGAAATPARSSRQSSAAGGAANKNNTVELSRSLSHSSNKELDKQQNLDASMTSTTLNDVFATMSSNNEQDSSLAAAKMMTSSSQQSQVIVTTESSANYDQFPEGGVRIEITAASSRTLPSPSGHHHHPSSDSAASPTPLSQQPTIPEEQPSARARDQSRPFSSGADTDTDDLEKLIQHSTSGGETLSIRDEDDDGVESDVGADDEVSLARRRDKDSGTNASQSSVSQKPPTSATTESDSNEQAPTAQQPYSRAQSSTKSVRIMETPIVLDGAGADADYGYEYDQRKQQARDDEDEPPEEARRIWVDALGRAHQTPTTMKMARPLQRMKMKSSVVRVKSVSEQVHKNINQYEKQRALIEELKRLKRLQISKRNGVDPQFVTRSFDIIARKNTMIQSTGGIDGAEKLLYDELYRRRLTEYRYIPEYHVEPSNDFAIFQVHNHRSPPMTMSANAWRQSSAGGAAPASVSLSRATSAPNYESPRLKQHFEVETKRINREMMQRVEKAYVPPAHIQQLLDREDQLNSARSGTAMGTPAPPHHLDGKHSASGTPRNGQFVTGMSPANATLIASSPYGESIRPHTSPPKLQQPPQQPPVMPTSTTVLSRGGFINIKTQNAQSKQQPPAHNYHSPRNRENAAPSASAQVANLRRTAADANAASSARKSGRQQAPPPPQQMKAGQAHTPHMVPLLASLIDGKTNNRNVVDTTATRSGSVNLPEV